MGISVPCSQSHKGPNPLLFVPEPQSQELQHLSLVRVMDGGNQQCVQLPVLGMVRSALGSV